MSAGHSHGAGSGDSRRPRGILLIIVVACGLLTVAGVIALRPTHHGKSRAAELGLTSERHRAVVIEVIERACQYDDAQTCAIRRFRVSDGPDQGRIVELPEQNVGDAAVPRLSVGDRIVIGYEPSTQTYFYADRDRRTSLIGLGFLFAAAVIVLGRARGLAALAALALTLLVIVQFIVPAVLDGRSPLWVAIIGASVIAYLALYLTHGVTETTTIALLGTLGSLAVTALLAWTFFRLANFSGWADEGAAYLHLVSGTIDVRGLLLGGAVLGAMGALDDMTITQAGAVHELHLANPSLDARELYHSAMRIGRDHVGSTVNTLLLAYVGASMPLLVLFVLSGQSLGTVANSEVVALEIVRTLVGSIGLIAAVPLTTGLAAWAIGPPGNHPDDDDELSKDDS